MQYFVVSDYFNFLMAGVEGFEPSNAGVMAIGSGTDPPSACTSRALPLDDPMKSCALPLGDTPILILYCSFELLVLYHTISILSSP